MNILIVGSGGREHALAWKAAMSAGVATVFVAPGNAGTATEPRVENVALGVSDFAGLADFAERNGVALTIVGPEVPLAEGIRDYFDARGLACFGPSKAAAQLEGSKSFAKAFLKRHGIPTAAYEVFSDVAAAQAYVREQGVPIVIKADGLAAGKGVVVAQSEAEAEAAVADMLSGNAFGEAGHRVVIEEFLTGEEASFICLCDGERALPFASAQDHKARDDGDRGPNTGGMGAYSPAPVVDQALHERAMREVIEPTLKGMRADGMPYQGFLYAGLMVTAAGEPKVIEFNCRFGDPEAQPMMMRLRSDLVALCARAIGPGLHDTELTFDERVALGVVVAAGGYPGSYRGGDPISGLDVVDAPDCKVFHAGTSLVDGAVCTSGGRVLCVVGLGSDVAAAQQRAYEGVAQLSFKDAFYRSDIGYRAINRT
ncbi:MAG: phosphoribosylamine--glycine ligase [Pseudomonadales bacterium]